jgi:diguanylate cyclase (GGDEF)-like protein
VMVLPTKSNADASSVIQRLVDSVSRTFSIGNRKINLSCSIGLAVYPRDGKDAAALLRRADAQMYRAKELKPSSVERNAIEARSIREPLDQQQAPGRQLRVVRGR